MTTPHNRIGTRSPVSPRSPRKSKTGFKSFYRDQMNHLKSRKLKPIHLIYIFAGVLLLLLSGVTNHLGKKSRITHEWLNEEVKISPSYEDVLFFDEAVMKNVRATFEGSRSWLKWAAESVLEVTVADKLDQFQVLPLLATVDRRPLTANKQMKLDADGLHKDGDLLGCALTATTFVSKIENVYMSTIKDFPVECSVCLQFTNREDMNSFLPGVGFQPQSGYQESIATKCFGGLAENSARFVKWQSKDERFEGFGYPFTVDCTLPNGIKELTCRELSKMQNNIETVDELQSIYLQTKFTLDGYFADPYAKTFHVFSRWPWEALQSHDDDRRKIAKALPKTWNDSSSDFIPKSKHDMKLLHIEGPGYTMEHYNGGSTLRSAKHDKDKKGGLHFRLLVNLFHLARNAPNSSHMMAIVDGQARASFKAMQVILNTKLQDLFDSYGNVFTNNYTLDKDELIPIANMKGNASKRIKASSMTLKELLRSRGISLHIVPVASPSLSFEKSVCGGQYTFAAYVAARYAADYHVMMYIDGDTAMIEGSSGSLRDVLYDRFFSEKSTKCAGHRIRLIEQFVKPEDDKIKRILQCTEEVALDANKWKYLNDNCHLKEGHIVARTDSILAMSVHHPDTDTKYTPEGIEDCITPGNKENDRYFLKSNEFVQLHLRNRLRKDECVCFADVKNA